MTLTEMTQLLANGGTLAVLMYFMFVKSDAQTQAIGKLTTAVEKLNILLQSKGENYVRRRYRNARNQGKW